MRRRSVLKAAGAAAVTAIAGRAAAIPFINPYQLGSQLEGALAYRTSADWDTELYDLTGWHDNSTNPTRFTLSSNALVRVSSCGVPSSGSPSSDLKNGAAFAGRSSYFDTQGAVFRPRTSGIVSASAADYFEMPTTGSTASVFRWASIEVLPSTKRYCLLRKTSNQTLTAATNNTITWDTEVADVGGWFDSGTSTTNVVVPSGCTAIRVTSQVECVTLQTTGSCLAAVFINGAALWGLQNHNVENVITNYFALNGVGAVMQVSPGDILTFLVNPSLAQTATGNEGTWICVEEVLEPWKRVLCRRDAATTQSYTSGVAQAINFDVDVYDVDGLHDTASNNSKIIAPAGTAYGRLSANVNPPSATGVQAAEFHKNGATFQGSSKTSTATTGGDRLNIATGWFPCVAGDEFQTVFTTGANLTLGAGNAIWFAAEFRAI